MIVPTYETTAKEQEMMINELRSINRTQENRINIQKEEIERLNKERSKTYENGLNYFLELQKKKEEIERLNNIIKEVREWVEKNKCKFTRDDETVVSEVSFVVNAKPSELLEILDKVGDEK